MKQSEPWITISEAQLAVFGGGYIPHPIEVEVALTHAGGTSYNASYTVRWDPNGVVYWNTVVPEERILTLNEQTGATFGEHEEVFHGDLARHLMANDFPNVVLSGDFTLTARGPGQVTRDTDPSAFAGTMIRFPGLALPTTFSVGSVSPGDEAGATAIVQAEIDDKARQYLNAALKEAIIYFSHGPGYEIESDTRYDQSQGLVTTQPAPLNPPQIRTRF